MHTLKIKEKIDRQIQNSLRKQKIEVPLDPQGNILISEYKIDEMANVAMCYISPKSVLPTGKIPFAIIDAEYVYGVFYLNQKAVIIEIGIKALKKSLP